jgi:hypothetical protein
MCFNSGTNAFIVSINENLTTTIAELQVLQI